MTNLIGVAGVAILLVFFILNRLHRISTENIWYDVGNFAGAFLLVIYAYILGSIPFFVLEGVWALFSLLNVVKGLKKKN